MNVVVTSLRNEAPYLFEWVAWNLYIGFDKIVAFTNNNTDNTIEVLEYLQEKGVVEFKELFPTKDEKPQMKAFKEGLNWCKKNKPKWISCLDPDEFIVLKKDKNIKEFVNRFPNADAIAINWKVFGSSGIKFKGLGLTPERFLKHAPKDYIQHKQFKSIFKFSDKISRFHHRVIYPKDISDEITYIFSNGELFSKDEKKTGFNQFKSEHKVNFDNAQINHYTIRSYEELDSKMFRGNGIKSVGENKNRENYLKVFDKNQIFETTILEHFNEYLKIYKELIRDFKGEF